jgi:predicted dehydrogenase
MKPVKVGVVGCGNISGIYMKNVARFEAFDIVACTDLIRKRATDGAKKYNIPKPCTPKQMYADKSVELIINLTPPGVHSEVNMKALNAGKHVYTEKPLSLSRDEAKATLDLAKKKGLLVGGAPDTVLGAGIQTCRKLIDEGWIGKPMSATAFMLSHGPEGWHPDPDFFFKPGAGPMFDMGPYYISTLITLMGGVKRVSGATGSAFAERMVGSGEKKGELITVETPTHVASTLDFHDGAIATLVTSFDVWHHNLPNIEIHGTTGSLSVPDPNTFGGPVKLFRAGAEDWSEIPLTHAYPENSRGLGVADMACAIRSGRAHRANGAMAYHVLDVMHATHEASEQGKHVNLSSKFKRSAPMPMNLEDGQLDP